MANGIFLGMMDVDDGAGGDGDGNDSGDGDGNDSGDGGVDGGDQVVGKAALRVRCLLEENLQVPAKHHRQSDRQIH